MILNNRILHIQVDSHGFMQIWFYELNMQLKMQLNMQWNMYPLENTYNQILTHAWDINNSNIRNISENVL